MRGHFIGKFSFNLCKRCFDDKKAFVQEAHRMTRGNLPGLARARGQEVTKVLSDFIQGQQDEWRTKQKKGR